MVLGDGHHSQLTIVMAGPEASQHDSYERKHARIPELGIRSAARSLSHDVCEYYLEMPGVIDFVESGAYGPFDEAGVPLATVGSEEHVYNTTIIAQYALALHDRFQRLGEVSCERKFAVQVEAITREIQRAGEWRGFVVHRWSNPKYLQLRAPWVSALAQGTAISALLRGYLLWRDAKLLDEATAMFQAMERPVKLGGVRVEDRCGHVWFEEYPMTPPCHVLNGFIFALWGIVDFARVTGNENAWRWWHQGVLTLKSHLPEFDCGFWSLYDLRYRELAALHYHRNIHPAQLEAMYALTGEKSFLDYAIRWRHFGDNWRCRGRWWLGLRIGAFKRGWQFD